MGMRYYEAVLYMDVEDAYDYGYYEKKMFFEESPKNILLEIPRRL